MDHLRIVKYLQQGRYMPRKKPVIKNLSGKWNKFVLMAEKANEHAFIKYWIYQCTKVFDSKIWKKI